LVYLCTISCRQLQTSHQGENRVQYRPLTTSGKIVSAGYACGPRSVRVIKNCLTFAFIALFMAACAETQFIAQTVKSVGQTQKDRQGESSSSVYKVGKPYQIKGVWYYPAENLEYDETGISSWYGAKFHGRKTANGEIFDMNEISAAHRTLPLPSLVRVTNLENGRTLKVRVNDRGPYAHGRIIDLSRRASQLLGFEKQGTARVRVTVLKDETLAAAVRLKGQNQLASIGSPITIDSLPKAKVSSEALPVLAGGDTAPPPLAPDDRKTQGEQQLVSSLSGPPIDVVTVEPVSPTNVYIQAGAFSNFENANRVRARLIDVGPVKISPVLVNGRDLFRVRIGPMTSIDDADLMLEQVINAGYTDARTLVD